MTVIAFVTPVVTEHIEDLRKAATEVEGARHEAHRDLLQRSGIHVERTWLQQLPDGSASLIAYWDCDDISKAWGWPEPRKDYDVWFRETVLRTYLGLDPDLVPDEWNRLVLDTRAIDGESVGAYALAAPVLPGKLDEFMKICEELGTTRARSHQQMLASCGVRNEKVFLQTPPPQLPDAPAMAIICWDCDDPHRFPEAVAAGETEHARFMHEAVVKGIHGLDFSAGIPPSNGLLTVTHNRHGDGDEAPGAVVRRCFSAFAARDMDTVARLMDPNCTMSFAGRSRMAGQWRGRTAVIERLRMPSTLTGGTFRTEVLEQYDNDGGSVLITHSTAQRNSSTLDTRLCAVFGVTNGRIDRIEYSCVSDQYALDEFWDAALDTPR